MGKFFISKIWLEDREIDVLRKYNFKEEIWEKDIPKEEHWILDDLTTKGFLYSVTLDWEDKKRSISIGDKYYQGAGGYLQHFDNNLEDYFLNKMSEKAEQETETIRLSN